MGGSTPGGMAGGPGTVFLCLGVLRCVDLTRCGAPWEGGKVAEAQLGLA